MFAMLGKSRARLRRILATTTTGVALAAVAALAVAAEVKPAKELITGEIHCLYAYVAEPNLGEKAVEFETTHIVKKGNPAVLVQEGTGELFFLLGKNGESVVPKIDGLLGKKVNIQGPVYRKGGVAVVEVLVAAESM